MSNNTLIKVTGILDGKTHQTEIIVHPIPLFHVHIRPAIHSYSGHFGFDWMRDSSVINEIDYIGKCRNFSQLEAQYEFLEIVQGQKYYVPWLSMFPKNEEVVGKPVELYLIPGIAQEGYDYIEDEDFIKILSPSGNLRIENEVMTDLYNKHAFKVFCDKPLTSNDYLDVKLFKGKADKIGHTVGKLNIVKNDVTYIANIYIINNFCSDLLVYQKSDLTQILDDNGGINRIKDYLNKQSLNQALIQVNFIQVIDLAFKESSLNTVSQRGLDPALPLPGGVDPLYSRFKQMYNQTTKTVDNLKYLHYIHFRFSLLHPGLLQEKCILLYLTTMRSTQVAGAAMGVPLDNKHCIIYNDYIKKDTTIAHELGHILGLAHTFYEKDQNGTEMTHNNEEADYIQRGSSIEQKYMNIYKLNKNGYLDPNKHSDTKMKQKVIADKQFINYMIDYGKQCQIDASVFVNDSDVRFDQSSTDNFMDYSINRIFFSKKQWETMQREIMQNHGCIK